jgi:hypothetical protein
MEALLIVTENDIDLIEEDSSQITEKKLNHLLSQVVATRFIINKLKRIYMRQFLSLQESFLEEFNANKHRVANLELEISRLKLAMKAEEAEEEV